MAHFTIMLFLLMMATSIFAKEYNSSYYSYAEFPWPYKRQFNTWWANSWWALQLDNVSKGACNETLHDYNTAFDSGYDTQPGKLLYSVCYQHTACLLDNLSTDIVANYQSAMVILGLMPSMLIMLGPSLADVALLSRHRPLLSILISLGAPAIWPSRIGVFQNPTATLLDDNRANSGNLVDKFLMRQRSLRYGILLSMAEYILLLGAVANVIELSLEIGFKSIVSFRCTAQYLVFLWVMLALPVHLMTVLGVALRKYRPQQSAEDTADNDSFHSKKPPTIVHGIDLATSNASDTLLDLHSGNITSKQSKRSLLTRLRSEFEPCMRHTDCCCLDDVSEAGYLATGFNLAAGCFSNIHFIVGVIIFSSQQLISVWEVTNRILWRFVVSAVVCRIVMIVEVTAIRKHTRKT